VAKKKLTDALVTALEPAKKQYLVRDTEVPGFFVMVGARTKTWTIQIDVTDLLTGKARERPVGWPRRPAPSCGRGGPRGAGRHCPRRGENCAMNWRRMARASELSRAMNMA
jgi:hypothetical protein